MSLTKATITNLDTKKVIKCLFNPTEYTIARTNSWQRSTKQGNNVGKLDFTGGGSRTMTVELFFDVYELGEDVRKYTAELWNLTLIEPGTKNQKTKTGRPPLCLFQWGPNWHFTAAVTSLSVRYTLFQSDGTPVRAVASLSLQEAEDGGELNGTNPTSYAEPGHRRREVRMHDTLPLIAYEEYGDPNKWRLIADANKLHDPTAIEEGDIIAIPAI